MFAKARFKISAGILFNVSLEISESIFSGMCAEAMLS
jgi:hypothetical protein